MDNSTALWKHINRESLSLLFFLNKTRNKLSLRFVFACVTSWIDVQFSLFFSPYQFSLSLSFRFFFFLDIASMLFSKVSTEFFSFRHYSSDTHFFNANKSILHGRNILVMVPK